MRKLEVILFEADGEHIQIKESKRLNLVSNGRPGSVDEVIEDYFQEHPRAENVYVIWHTVGGLISDNFYMRKYSRPVPPVPVQVKL